MTQHPGSERECPACGSLSVKYATDLKHKGYGKGMASCSDCGALWEPYEVNQLSDPSDHLSVLKHPCNNCAFRKGSPESQDPWGMLRILEHIEDGCQFSCHKGQRIDSDSPHGYDYSDDPLLRRPCRGAKNLKGKDIVTIVNALCPTPKDS